MWMLWAIVFAMMLAGLIAATFIGVVYHVWWFGTICSVFYGGVIGQAVGRGFSGRRPT